MNGLGCGAGVAGAGPPREPLQAAGPKNRKSAGKDSGGLCAGRYSLLVLDASDLHRIRGLDPTSHKARLRSSCPEAPFSFQLDGCRLLWVEGCRGRRVREYLPGR